MSDKQKKTLRCRSSDLSTIENIRNGILSENDGRVLAFLAFENPEDAYEWATQYSAAFREEYQ